MNAKQRKELEKALDIIQTTYDEEVEKLYNMEGFENTMRYQDMEEKKDALEQAIEYLQEAME